MPTATTIAATIRALLRERAGGASICPSEVARALAEKAGEPEWRRHMPDVRRTAAKMAASGALVATQRGREVDASNARGPIRLAWPSGYAGRYRGIDFRQEPERYRVGRGEEGVLLAEPYKSELLPLWRFRTPAVAKESAAALWAAFRAYRQTRDFVGMDMARKYLQMGFTRARRYANHRSGRKYYAQHRVAPVDPDAVKAEAAQIFYEVWQRAERDRVYRAWRKRQAA